MYILILLLILSFFSCSIDNNVVNRISGDITGLRNKTGTVMYYSTDNDSLSSYITLYNDTVINSVRYREIINDYTREYYSFTDDMIYRRYTTDDSLTVNAPYLYTFLIENNTFTKDAQTHNYAYDFSMHVDSLTDFSHNGQIHQDAYFVRKSIEIITAADTLISCDTLILSYEEGMIGFRKNNEWFFIDSIIR